MESAIALLGVGQDHRPALAIKYEASQYAGSRADLARAAALPLLGQLCLNLIP